MTTDSENRRSFRVSESAYIRYEIISDEEFAAGLAHRKIRLGQSDGAQSLLVDIEARLSESVYRLTAESEHLGRCITLLNDKINIVIEQLPGLRQTKASLARSTPQTADVGADGIVFANAEDIPAGSKLYLQLLLASDNRFIESFCRVVRTTDVPAGNDPSTTPYGIAIEFIGMKPSQREVLIQHMFNRESETLRMRRLQLEEQTD